MKRTPLRKVSKKRAVQNRKYSKLKKEFLEGCVCTVCLDEHYPDAAKIRSAVDVHHKHGRVGEMLNNQLFWMAVCREHHDMIHQNPAWARENGYLK
jgi:hypothetical protein